MKKILFVIGSLRAKSLGNQGTVLRSALFPVEKAVDDSVWDSGESGKLAETCSKVETGEYNFAA